MLTTRAVQSAGDKSQEPKGICSQRGDTEQWDFFFFFFSFCTVIKQLAWADTLKLLGILITCTSRYTVWAARNRVSEGSAPTSSFAPSSQFLPALSSHPATATAAKLLFFTYIWGEKISLDYAAKKP